MFSYFPPMQSPFISSVPQTQTIQYVNGKASAEAYQLPVNSSVILMDSNIPRFYMKQTDASGISTIKSFDFTEAEEDKPKEYVTKEEFETFKTSLKGAKNEPNADSNVKQRHNV